MSSRNERQYHSETRKRTQKEDLKREKIQLLKFKFKKALNNLHKLKRQNNEDYDHLRQLMINSQRLNKRAYQSREKTKQLISDSWEQKMKMKALSPSIENNQVSNFNLLAQSPIQKHKPVQNEKQTNVQKNMTPVKRKIVKRDQQSIQKLCALKRQQIEQVSVQNQYSERKSSNNTPKHSRTADSDLKQSLLQKKSVSSKNVGLREPSMTAYKKKVLKEGIRPYIIAVIFSILLLFWMRL